MPDREDAPLVTTPPLARPDRDAPADEFDEWLALRDRLLEHI